MQVLPHLSRGKHARRRRNNLGDLADNPGGRRRAVCRKNIQHLLSNVFVYRGMPLRACQGVGVGKTHLRITRGQAQQLPLKTKATLLRSGERLGRSLSGSAFVWGGFPACKTARAVGISAPLRRARGLKARQCVEGVLLTRADTPGDMASVVFGKQGVFYGSKNRKRIGKRSRTSLGTRKIMTLYAPIYSVLHQRLRAFQQPTKLFDATLRNEIGRIKIVGKRNGAQFYFGTTRLGGHAAVDELQSAVGSTLARRVSVEQIYDAMLSMSRQNSQVTRCKRGAERGNHIGKPRLMKHDHVGVSLNNHRRSG